MPNRFSDCSHDQMMWAGEKSYRCGPLGDAAPAEGWPAKMMPHFVPIRMRSRIPATSLIAWPKSVSE